jgi:long-chain acyl-CoA synthetase
LGRVHNAYGLTEAPLVTINRPGANRLGTVGQPLPETELRIADDGEVLVRGPQVMVCYATLRRPARRLAASGDLGHLTADGSRSTAARRTCWTAYSKYIERRGSSAARIPGVAEAMVVGEGRPFCTALLWTDDIDDTGAIDRAVLDANRRLSHPEQVKRWATLRNDLSVENGELTANLKLKRHRVESRFRGLIESLYEEHPAAPIRSALREEVRT